MPGTITVSVRGDMSPLRKELKRVASTPVNLRFDSAPLGRIKGDLGEFEKSLAASNARVLAFGASAGIIMGVQTAFREMVNSALEVEKRLTEVNTVLNTSNSELQRFGSNLFDVARNTAQSFDVVSEAALEFARQGLGMEETLKRTRDALVLVRIAGMDAASAVNAITAAINGFSSAALDSTEIISKMAQVDQAFAVSTNDLAESLRRVASTAESAGVSFDQLLAVVTAAQQTTARGGTIIGNSFKTIFTRMQRPRTLEALEQIGIQTRKASGEMRPMMTLLTELARTYDTLAGAQRAQIAELVGGVFQINILKATLSDLSKEFSVYENALKTAGGASNEAIRRNEKLNETMDAMVNRTFANLKQVGAKMGEDMLGPALKKTMGGLNKLMGMGGGGATDKESEGTGKRMAAAITKGMGSFLSGPGLTLGFMTLFKLFDKLRVYATDAFGTIAKSGGKLKEQKAISDQLNTVLGKEPDLLKNILDGTTNIYSAHARVLNILKEETQAMKEQTAIADILAKRAMESGVRSSAGGLVVSESPTASRGHVPSFQAAAGPGGSGGAAAGGGGSYSIGPATPRGNMLSEVNTASQLGAAAGVRAKRSASSQGQIQGEPYIYNTKEQVFSSSKIYSMTAGRVDTRPRPGSGSFHEGEPAVLPNYRPEVGREFNQRLRAAQKANLGQSGGYVPNFNMGGSFMLSRGGIPNFGAQKDAFKTGGKAELYDFDYTLQKGDPQKFGGSATTYPMGKIKPRQGEIDSWVANQEMIWIDSTNVNKSNYKELGVSKGAIGQARKKAASDDQKRTYFKTLLETGSSADAAKAAGDVKPAPVGAFMTMPESVNAMGSTLTALGREVKSRQGLPNDHENYLGPIEVFTAKGSNSRGPIKEWLRAQGIDADTVNTVGGGVFEKKTATGKMVKASGGEKKGLLVEAWMRKYIKEHGADALGEMIVHDDRMENITGINEAVARVNKELGTNVNISARLHKDKDLGEGTVGDKWNDKTHEYEKISLLQEPGESDADYKKRTMGARSTHSMYEGKDEKGKHKFGKYSTHPMMGTGYISSGNVPNFFTEKFKWERKESHEERIKELRETLKRGADPDEHDEIDNMSLKELSDTVGAHVDFGEEQVSPLTQEGMFRKNVVRHFQEGHTMGRGIVGGSSAGDAVKERKAKGLDPIDMWRFKSDVEMSDLKPSKDQKKKDFVVPVQLWDHERQSWHDSESGFPAGKLAEALMGGQVSKVEGDKAKYMLMGGTAGSLAGVIAEDKFAYYFKARGGKGGATIDFPFLTEQEGWTAEKAKAIDLRQPPVSGWKHAEHKNSQNPDLMKKAAQQALRAFSGQEIPIDEVEVDATSGKERTKKITIPDATFTAGLNDDFIREVRGLAQAGKSGGLSLDFGVRIPDSYAMVTPAGSDRESYDTWIKLDTALANTPSIKKLYGEGFSGLMEAYNKTGGPKDKKGRGTPLKGDDRFRINKEKSKVHLRGLKVDAYDATQLEANAAFGFTPNFSTSSAKDPKYAVVDRLKNRYIINPSETNEGAGGWLSLADGGVGSETIKRSAAGNRRAQGAVNYWTKRLIDPNDDLYNEDLLPLRVINAARGHVPNLGKIAGQVLDSDAKQEILDKKNLIGALKLRQSFEENKASPGDVEVSGEVAEFLKPLLRRLRKNRRRQQKTGRPGAFAGGNIPNFAGYGNFSGHTEGTTPSGKKINLDLIRKEETLWSRLKDVVKAFIPVRGPKDQERSVFNLGNLLSESKIKDSVDNLKDFFNQYHPDINLNNLFEPGGRGHSFMDAVWRGNEAVFKSLGMMDEEGNVLPTQEELAEVTADNERDFVDARFNARKALDPADKNNDLKVDEQMLKNAKDDPEKIRIYKELIKKRIRAEEERAADIKKRREARAVGHIPNFAEGGGTSMGVVVGHTTTASGGLKIGGEVMTGRSKGAHPRKSSHKGPGQYQMIGFNENLFEDFEGILDESVSARYRDMRNNVANDVFKAAKFKGDRWPDPFPQDPSLAGHTQASAALNTVWKDRMQGEDRPESEWRSVKGYMLESFVQGMYEQIDSQEVDWKAERKNYEAAGGPPAVGEESPADAGYGTKYAKFDERFGQLFEFGKEGVASTPQGMEESMPVEVKGGDPKVWGPSDILKKEQILKWHATENKKKQKWLKSANGYVPAFFKLIADFDHYGEPDADRALANAKKNEQDLTPEEAQQILFGKRYKYLKKLRHAFSLAQSKGLDVGAVIGAAGVGKSKTVGSGTSLKEGTNLESWAGGKPDSTALMVVSGSEKVPTKTIDQATSKISGISKMVNNWAASNPEEARAILGLGPKSNVPRITNGDVRQGGTAGDPELLHPLVKRAMQNKDGTAKKNNRGRKWAWIRANALKVAGTTEQTGIPEDKLREGEQQLLRDIYDYAGSKEGGIKVLRMDDDVLDDARKLRADLKEAGVTPEGMSADPRTKRQLQGTIHAAKSSAFDPLIEDLRNRGRVVPGGVDVIDRTSDQRRFNEENRRLLGKALGFIPSFAGGPDINIEREGQVAGVLPKKKLPRGTAGALGENMVFDTQDENQRFILREIIRKHLDRTVAERERHADDPLEDERSYNKAIDKAISATRKEVNGMEGWFLPVKEAMRVREGLKSGNLKLNVAEGSIPSALQAMSLMGQLPSFARAVLDQPTGAVPTFFADFSSQVSDARGREVKGLMRRGISKSAAEGSVYVGTHPRITANAGHVGVFNKFDEPSGPAQGIQRAMSEGANINTYGMSGGHVPHFASLSLEDVLEDLGYKPRAGETREKGVPSESEVERLMERKGSEREEAGKEGGLMDRAQGSVTSGFEALTKVLGPLGKFLDKMGGGKAEAIKQIDKELEELWEQFREPINDPTTTDAERSKARKIFELQADPLQKEKQMLESQGSAGMGVARSEKVAEAVGQDVMQKAFFVSQGMSQIGAIIPGLAKPLEKVNGAYQTWASISTAIPGPAGRVLGGIVAAGTLMDDIAGMFADWAADTYHLAEEAEVSQAKFTKLNDSISQYTATFDMLLESSKNPATPFDTLTRLNDKLESLLASIPEEYRAEVALASNVTQLKELGEAIRQTEGARDQILQLVNELVSQQKEAEGGFINTIMRLLPGEQANQFKTGGFGPTGNTRSVSDQQRLESHVKDMFSNMFTQRQAEARAQGKTFKAEDIDASKFQGLSPDQLIKALQQQGFKPADLDKFFQREKGLLGKLGDAIGLDIGGTGGAQDYATEMGEFIKGFKDVAKGAEDRAKQMEINQRALDALATATDRARAAFSKAVDSFSKAVDFQIKFKGLEQMSGRRVKLGGLEKDRGLQKAMGVAAGVGGIFKHETERAKIRQGTQEGVQGVQRETFVQQGKVVTDALLKLRGEKIPGSEDASKIDSAIKQFNEVMKAQAGKTPEEFNAAIETFVKNNKDLLGSLGGEIVQGAKDNSNEMVRQIKELMLTEKEQLTLLNKQYELDKKIADLERLKKVGGGIQSFMDPEKGPLSGQLNQFMQGLTVMGKARERGVAGGTPANMQAIRGEMQMMSAMKGMMGGKLFDASARPGETAEQTQQRVQSENPEFFDFKERAIPQMSEFWRNTFEDAARAAEGAGNTGAAAQFRGMAGRSDEIAEAQFDAEFLSGQIPQQQLDELKEIKRLLGAGGPIATAMATAGGYDPAAGVTAGQVQVDAAGQNLGNAIAAEQAAVEGPGLVPTAQLAERKRKAQAEKEIKMEELGRSREMRDAMGGTAPERTETLTKLFEAGKGTVEGVLKLLESGGAGARAAGISVDDAQAQKLTARLEKAQRDMARGKKTTLGGQITSAAGASGASIRADFEVENRNELDRINTRIRAKQREITDARGGGGDPVATSNKIKRLEAELKTLEQERKDNLSNKPPAARGFIPNFSADHAKAERTEARLAGYQPGAVRTLNIPEVMGQGGTMTYNTAEKVSYAPGFRQPFISPPEFSEAGIEHKQLAIKTTGLNPYALAAEGYVPNFAAGGGLNEFLFGSAPQGSQGRRGRPSGNDPRMATFRDAIPARATSGADQLRESFARSRAGEMDFEPARPRARYDSLDSDTWRLPLEERMAGRGFVPNFARTMYDRFGRPMNVLGVGHGRSRKRGRGRMGTPSGYYNPRPSGYGVRGRRPPRPAPQKPRYVLGWGPDQQPGTRDDIPDLFQNVDPITGLPVTGGMQGTLKPKQTQPVRPRRQTAAQIRTNQWSYLQYGDQKVSDLDDLIAGWGLPPGRNPGTGEVDPNWDAVGPPPPAPQPQHAFNAGDRAARAAALQVSRNELAASLAQQKKEFLFRSSWARNNAVQGRALVQAQAGQPIQGAQPPQVAAQTGMYWSGGGKPATLWSIGAGQAGNIQAQFAGFNQAGAEADMIAEAKEETKKEMAKRAAETLMMEVTGGPTPARRDQMADYQNIFIDRLKKAEETRMDKETRMRTSRYKTDMIKKYGRVWHDREIENGVESNFTLAQRLGYDETQEGFSLANSAAWLVGGLGGLVGSPLKWLTSSSKELTEMRRTSKVGFDQDIISQFGDSKVGLLSLAVMMGQMGTPAWRDAKGGLNTALQRDSVLGKWVMEEGSIGNRFFGTMGDDMIVDDSILNAKQRADESNSDFIKRIEDEVLAREAGRLTMADDARNLRWMGEIHADSTRNREASRLEQARDSAAWLRNVKEGGGVGGNIQIHDSVDVDGKPQLRATIDLPEAFGERAGFFSRPGSRANLTHGADGWKMNTFNADGSTESMNIVDFDQVLLKDDGSTTTTLRQMLTEHYAAAGVVDPEARVSEMARLKQVHEAEGVPMQDEMVQLREEAQKIAEENGRNVIKEEDWAKAGERILEEKHGDFGEKQRRRGQLMAWDVEELAAQERHDVRKTRATERVTRAKSHLGHVEQWADATRNYEVQKTQLLELYKSRVNGGMPQAQAYELYENAMRVAEVEGGFQPRGAVYEYDGGRRSAGLRFIDPITGAESFGPRSVGALDGYRSGAMPDEGVAHQDLARLRGVFAEEGLWSGIIDKPQLFGEGHTMGDAVENWRAGVAKDLLGTGGIIDKAVLEGRGTIAPTVDADGNRVVSRGRTEAIANAFEQNSYKQAHGRLTSNLRAGMAAGPHVGSRPMHGAGPILQTVDGVYYTNVAEMQSDGSMTTRVHRLSEPIQDHMAPRFQDQHQLAVADMADSVLAAEAVIREPWNASSKMIANAKGTLLSAAAMDPAAYGHMDTAWMVDNMGTVDTDGGVGYKTLFADEAVLGGRMDMMREATMREMSRGWGKGTEGHQILMDKIMNPVDWPDALLTPDELKLRKLHIEGGDLKKLGEMRRAQDRATMTLEEVQVEKYNKQAMDKWRASGSDPTKMPELRQANRRTTGAATSMVEGTFHSGEMVGGTPGRNLFHPNEMVSPLSAEYKANPGKYMQVPGSGTGDSGPRYVLKETALARMPATFAPMETIGGTSPTGGLAGGGMGLGTDVANLRAVLDSQGARMFDAGSTGRGADFFLAQDTLLGQLKGWGGGEFGAAGTADVFDFREALPEGYKAKFKAVGEHGVTLLSEPDYSARFGVADFGEGVHATERWVYVDEHGVPTEQIVADADHLGAIDKIYQARHNGVDNYLAELSADTDQGRVLRGQAILDEADARLREGKLNRIDEAAFRRELGDEHPANRKAAGVRQGGKWVPDPSGNTVLHPDLMDYSNLPEDQQQRAHQDGMEEWKKAERVEAQLKKDAGSKIMNRIQNKALMSNLIGSMSEPKSAVGAMLDLAGDTFYTDRGSAEGVKAYDNLEKAHRALPDVDHPDFGAKLEKLQQALGEAHRTGAVTEAHYEAGMRVGQATMAEGGAPAYEKYVRTAAGVMAMHEQGFLQAHEVLSQQSVGDLIRENLSSGTAEVKDRKGNTLYGEEAGYERYYRHQAMEKNAAMLELISRDPEILRMEQEWLGAEDAEAQRKVMQRMIERATVVGSDEMAAKGYNLETGKLKWFDSRAWRTRYDQTWGDLNARRMRASGMEMGSEAYAAKDRAGFGRGYIDMAKKGWAHWGKQGRLSLARGSQGNLEMRAMALGLGGALGAGALGQMLMKSDNPQLREVGEVLAHGGGYAVGFGMVAHGALSSAAGAPPALSVMDEVAEAASAGGGATGKPVKLGAATRVRGALQGIMSGQGPMGGMGWRERWEFFKRGMGGAGPAVAAETSEKLLKAEQQLLVQVGEKPGPLRGLANKLTTTGTGTMDRMGKLFRGTSKGQGLLGRAIGTKGMGLRNVGNFGGGVSLLGSIGTTAYTNWMYEDEEKRLTSLMQDKDPITALQASQDFQDMMMDKDFAATAGHVGWGALGVAGGIAAGMGPLGTVISIGMIAAMALDGFVRRRQNLQRTKMMDKTDMQMVQAGMDDADTRNKLSRLMFNKMGQDPEFGSAVLPDIKAGQSVDQDVAEKRMAGQIAFIQELMEARGAGEDIGDRNFYSSERRLGEAFAMSPHADQMRLEDAANLTVSEEIAAFITSFGFGLKEEGSIEERAQFTQAMMADIKTRTGWDENSLEFMEATQGVTLGTIGGGLGSFGSDVKGLDLVEVTDPRTKKKREVRTGMGYIRRRSEQVAKLRAEGKHDQADRYERIWAKEQEAMAPKIRGSNDNLDIDGDGNVSFGERLSTASAAFWSGNVGGVWKSIFGEKAEILPSDEERRAQEELETPTLGTAGLDGYVHRAHKSHSDYALARRKLVESGLTVDEATEELKFNEGSDQDTKLAKDFKKLEILGEVVDPKTGKLIKPTPQATYRDPMTGATTAILANGTHMEVMDRATYFQRLLSTGVLQIDSEGNYISGNPPKVWGKADDMDWEDFEASGGFTANIPKPESTIEKQDILQRANQRRIGDLASLTDKDSINMRGQIDNDIKARQQEFNRERVRALRFPSREAEAKLAAIKNEMRPLQRKKTMIQLENFANQVKKLSGPPPAPRKPGYQQALGRMRRFMIMSQQTFSSSNGRLGIDLGNLNQQGSNLFGAQWDLRTKENIDAGMSAVAEFEIDQAGVGGGSGEISAMTREFLIRKAKERPDDLTEKEAEYMQERIQAWSKGAGALAKQGRDNRALMSKHFPGGRRPKAGDSLPFGPPNALARSQQSYDMLQDQYRNINRAYAQGRTGERYYGQANLGSAIQSPDDLALLERFATGGFDSDQGGFGAFVFGHTTPGVGGGPARTVADQSAFLGPEGQDNLDRLRSLGMMQTRLDGLNKSISTMGPNDPQRRNAERERDALLRQRKITMGEVEISKIRLTAKAKKHPEKHYILTELQAGNIPPDLMDEAWAIINSQGKPPAGAMNKLRGVLVAQKKAKERKRFENMGDPEKDLIKQQGEGLFGSMKGRKGSGKVRFGTYAGFKGDLTGILAQVEKSGMTAAEWLGLMFGGGDKGAGVQVGLAADLISGGDIDPAEVRALGAVIGKMQGKGYGGGKMTADNAEKWMLFRDKQLARREKILSGIVDTPGANPTRDEGILGMDHQGKAISEITNMGQRKRVRDKLKKMLADKKLNIGVLSQFRGNTDKTFADNTGAANKLTGFEAGVAHLESLGYSKLEAKQIMAYRNMLEEHQGRRSMGGKDVDSPFVSGSSMISAPTLFAAEGFIPNFAEEDEIQKAKGREIQSVMNNHGVGFAEAQNSVYMADDPRITANNYGAGRGFVPNFGRGVFNTFDEDPSATDQYGNSGPDIGIERERRRGGMRAINTAGHSSRGYVPTFSTEGATVAPATNAPQSDGAQVGLDSAVDAFGKIASKLENASNSWADGGKRDNIEVVENIDSTQTSNANINVHVGGAIEAVPNAVAQAVIDWSKGKILRGGGYFPPSRRS